MGFFPEVGVLCSSNVTRPSLGLGPKKTWEGVFGGVENLQSLEPETPTLKWMFGETTVSQVKVWNHPIETTIKIWLFRVPGPYNIGLRGPYKWPNIDGNNWDYKPDKSGVIPPGKGDGATPTSYLLVKGTPSKPSLRRCARGFKHRSSQGIYSNVSILSFQSEKKQHVDPCVYVQVP